MTPEGVTRWGCSLDSWSLLLSQPELAIPGCRHSLAALAKGGVAAAVAHDPADILALDVAVDPDHPRVDLGEQQALARRNDVVGPGSGTRRGGLDAGQAAVACEADQPGRPIGAVFGSAREVAEPRIRAHDHQHIREVVHQDAEKGLRSVFHFSFSDAPSTPRMSMRSKLPVIASKPVA